MRLHLLYLSEDLAALPLFSEDISNDDKRATVSALQREPFSDVALSPTRCLCSGTARLQSSSRSGHSTSSNHFVYHRTSWHALMWTLGPIVLTTLPHARLFVHWRWLMTVQKRQWNWQVTSMKSSSRMTGSKSLTSSTWLCDRHLAHKILCQVDQSFSSRSWSTTESLCHLL